MRIGKLARQASVSTSKVRFYEAQGILPPPARLANGYRDYGDHVLQVLRFIDRAQGLGFTLQEIADHLSSPEEGGRKAQLQAKLEAKLAELDAHLDAVQTRRGMILDAIQEIRSAHTG